MNTSVSKKTSPRAEREVKAILETVGPDNRDAFERAVVAALEYYVDIKKAHNDFAQVLLAGFEDADPVKFIAAIQVHRDRMAELLSDRDENLVKVLENRDNQHIGHVMNRMTKGEFNISTQSGNMFHDTYVHRALRDNLREVAGDVLANRAVETPISDVKDHIERAVADSGSANVTGGPKRGP
jgi:hypothetical protein|nr:hypothetical protein [Neorhizobium tomejilense]